MAWQTISSMFPNHHLFFFKKRSPLSCLWLDKITKIIINKRAQHSCCRCHLIVWGEMHFPPAFFSFFHLAAWKGTKIKQHWLCCQFFLARKRRGDKNLQRLERGKKKIWDRNKQVAKEGDGKEATKQQSAGYLQRASEESQEKEEGWGRRGSGGRERGMRRLPGKTISIHAAWRSGED